MEELDKTSLIDIAVNQYKGGHYEDAIITCKNILILDRGCIAAYYGLTKSLIRLGRYNEALDIYGKALLVNKTKELYKRRGDLYSELRKYEYAYKDYIAAKLLGYDKATITPRIALMFGVLEDKRKAEEAQWDKEYLERYAIIAMDEEENYIDYVDDEYMEEMREEYNEQLRIVDEEYWGAYYIHNGFTKYYDEYN